MSAAGITTTTPEIVVPVVDADPYELANLLDPYPLHEMIREAGPVVWLPKYGVYAVGRYQEVKAVMSDHLRFSTTAGVGLMDKRDPEYASVRKRNPLTEEDPPVHTHARAGLQRILSPLVVRSWRERFERAAGQIVDRLLEDGRTFDAVPEIAQAFVLTVFPQSLGMNIPRQFLADVGEMNFFSLGPMNELRQASLERMGGALDWYETASTKQNVTPGSFGAQIHAAEEAGELAPGVAEGLINLVLRGGTDTTVAGISSVLLFLARHPEIWARLQADPTKARNVFEEALRLESPSQALYRLTTRDMEFSGMPLRGNTKILSLLGSANRDPRAWSRPDLFDLERQTAGAHLAFGSGPHVCIGQVIARLEAETMLQAIASRVGRIELAGAPEWRAVSALRSLKKLPLAFSPA